MKKRYIRKKLYINKKKSIYKIHRKKIKYIKI